MSEIRHDWLADRWVIFAPERSGRPDEYEASRADYEIRESRLRCPFCPGNENETPQPLFVIPSRPSKDSPSEWRVRVVPNKYPALETIEYSSEFNVSLQEILERSFTVADREDPNESPSERGKGPCDKLESLLFHRRTLIGAHEVIIEAPEHHQELSQLSEEQLRMVIEAYRQRLAYWQCNPTLQYAVVFKNVGADAGASLVHPHSQLIATSFVPPDIARLCHRMNHFLDEQEECYGCVVARMEKQKKERVVLESDSFIAYCPYAASLPFSIAITPKTHQHSFALLSDEGCAEFAKVLRSILRANASIHPKTAYNFVLHTSPFHQHWEACYHWRLEIFPRLTKVAGFEWGSNCFINTVYPELAAKQLRNSLDLQGK